MCIYIYIVDAGGYSGGGCKEKSYIILMILSNGILKIFYMQVISLWVKFALSRERQIYFREKICKFLFSIYKYLLLFFKLSTYSC